MELASTPGIGPDAAKRLEEAGVRTVEALLAADPEGLAPEARASPDDVRAWQRAARDAWERTPAPNPVDVLLREAEELRVVLRDRAATARVKVGSVWHEDVPIVIAKAAEAEARIRESLRENAVLLREKAETAAVRINGEWMDQAPLYKERLREVAEGGREVLEEVRVRVDEIREHRKAAGAGKKGFLGRLFG